MESASTVLERVLAEMSFQSSLVAMNAALRAENSQDAVAPIEVLVRNVRGSAGGKIGSPGRLATRRFHGRYRTQFRPLRTRAYAGTFARGAFVRARDR
jgi:hypothetical protein